MDGLAAYWADEILRGLAVGIVTPNEARAMLGLPPI